MATPEDKKQKYTVIKKGVDSHEIGDVIELTEAQAKSRIHKVKLTKEHKADEKAANTDDAKALKAANKRIEGLEAQAEIDQVTIATLQDAAKPKAPAKAVAKAAAK